MRDEQQLACAQRLYNVLTDGAPPAGYHVRRGFAVRDAASKQPLRHTYTDTWLPARERHADDSESDRPLNHYVLAQHLRGRYDVAWTAPSWSSLAVLDIDRPKLAADASPDAVFWANQQRDQVLADVWRAFDFSADRQPVCLATPGAGYHLVLPFCRTRDPKEQERTWPNQWAREWIEHVLHRAGLVLQPGRLELYPSGVRLRAPCGRGSALLVPQRPDDPDDLRLEPVHARLVDVLDGKTGTRTTVVRREIVAMTHAFLDRLESARRPLEEWIAGDDAPPAWSSTWGPFGDRATVAVLAERKKQTLDSQGLVPLFQHKEEVQKAAGAQRENSSGALLRGRAFYRRIAELSQSGLTDPGSRHDGALKLAWYHGVLCNRGREEVISEVRDWLEGHDHVSATRDRTPSGFVKQTLREVAHYYDTRVSKCTRAQGVDAPVFAGRPLHPADEQLVASHVASDARPAALRVLRFLHGRADQHGRVGAPAELSGTILSTLCGDGRISVDNADGSRSRRRAYVVALDELVRLGLLTLHCDYSTGNHGRQYSCWYEFGSGALPCSTRDGRFELARRAVEEGELVVVASGDRMPPEVRLERSEHAISGVGARREPWWVRMYQRRAFSPAEFFDADARKLLPGPFRHRRPPRSHGRSPADATIEEFAGSPLLIQSANSNAVPTGPSQELKSLGEGGGAEAATAPWSQLRASEDDSG